MPKIVDFALYPNFKPEEFVCKCGECIYSDPRIIPYIISDKLINHLQEVRLAINSPIVITNGVRCIEHHKDIYKKRYGDKWEEYFTPNSFHLADANFTFYAADSVPLMADWHFASHIYAYMRFNGIGVYHKQGEGGELSNLFIHSDVGFCASKPVRFYRTIYK